MDKNQKDFSKWKKDFDKAIVEILEEIKGKGLSEGFEVFKEQVLRTCFSAYQYDQNKSFLKSEKRNHERLERIVEEIPKQLEHLSALINFSEKRQIPNKFLNDLRQYRSYLNDIHSSFKDRKAWAYAGLIYPGTIKKDKNVIPLDLIYLSLVYHLTFLFRNFTAKQHFPELPEPSPLAKEYGVDPLDGENETNSKYWFPVDYQEMPECGSPCLGQTLKIVQSVLPDRKEVTDGSVQKLVKNHQKNGVLLTSWE